MRGQSRPCRDFVGHCTPIRGNMRRGAAAARKRPMSLSGKESAQGGCARDGYGVVILDRITRDADSADDLASAVAQRYAAGEADQAAVGVLDVEQRAARLGELADISGVH